MSHTYKINDRWTVICNSDFSGPLIVRDYAPQPADDRPEEYKLGEVETYILDIELFEGVIAEIIRQKKIGQIENMSDEQLIYGE